MEKRYAVMLTPKEINKILVILDNEIENKEKLLHSEDYSIYEIAKEWLTDLKTAKEKTEETWNRIPPWWN